MPSGQALGKWAPDAADPAVGRRCLRLAATGGGGDGDWSRLELFGPWRSLPPGRFHTFSILLRADRDSVPVLLRIQNGVIHGLLEQGLVTGQGLRRTVLVGREWRRYFIGGPLPSAFRDACRVHVGVPHGATVWADDAVLLPGPERPAAPGGLEAAAALDASGACLDVGRPAEGTVLLHNAGAGAPLRCALEWRIAPRDGDALAQGSEEAILEPGDTKTFAVRSPALARRGPYRLTVAATAGDRRGTAEAPFVVIQPLRDVAPDSPFLLHDGGAQLLSDLDRVRRIGAVSIRCAATTTWVSVEPREGQWEWRDTYHRRFFDNGLSLLGLLGFAPAWARGDASAFHWRETRVPPADLTRWAQYVEETVRHYRGRMDTWELWNEPNAQSFFSGTPEDYAALVKAAYPAAKRGNPDCLVMGLSLAGIGDKPLEFAEAAMKAGVLDGLDAISFHPYQAAPPEAQMPERIQQLRALARRYGRDLPLVNSEVGWQGTDVFDPGQPYFPQEKLQPPWDEQVQADVLVRSYVLCLAHGVTRYYWHKWFEERGDVGPDLHGLIRADWQRSPKAAVAAFNALIERLDRHAYDKRLGAADPAVHAYLFRREATTTLVAWVAEGEATLDGVRGQVFDVYGNALSAVDGALPLTPSPVYVIGR